MLFHKLVFLLLNSQLFQPHSSINLMKIHLHLVCGQVLSLEKSSLPGPQGFVLCISTVTASIAIIDIYSLVVCELLACIFM